MAPWWISAPPPPPAPQVDETGDVIDSSSFWSIIAMASSRIKVGAQQDERT